MKGEIYLTEDGSSTLKHSLLGDSYHSTGGALSESQHVYIGAGFDYIESNEISVFEMGFGTGLKCALNLQRAAQRNVAVDYHTVELYPSDLETVTKLNYFNEDLEMRSVFETLHRSQWNESSQITPNFRLTKYHYSLERDKPNKVFDLIYFDAFAYDTQPELWSREVFEQMAAMTKQGGVLVTYSSKGVVKQALREAGFEVKRLPGACGKHHMLRALKL
ncbi:MAG: tRNA (5-methylaminomethyl-2-thiouridine)(34)-methyltransferase MnmD [Rikenellaceae bacterium]|nr:tRNA (5-methylaminomethyl-2-thiouridine)(34)-methyltransferase MnmD [Rikenellaceae bacterium]